jgi:LmbE family N-acetylglucosaminyl deacetylase
MLFIAPNSSPDSDLHHDRSKSLPAPLDVIFVGAHPDDVEIACGGMIHKLSLQGCRVGIIDLTDGEPTPGCESPEIRWAEAESAARVLGVSYRRILALPNRRLFDSFESRVELAKEFRIWRPHAVVGLGSKTPMASPDHYQAVQITDAAVFYSRLSKWEEYFDGLGVHSIAKQFYYCLSFEPGRLPGFDSQLTVDIGDSLETKLEAIACYKTQFPPKKAHVLERVKALALATGQTAGFEAGEILVDTKPLGVRDLADWMGIGKRSS